LLKLLLPLETAKGGSRAPRPLAALLPKQHYGVACAWMFSVPV